MNGNGWIKLYRQVKHSSIWKSSIQFQIWMAILLSVELDGTIHVSSMADLLDKLDISCNRRTFYDIIRKLEKENMIILQVGNGIIIKVNNWEKYQMTENALQSESPHTLHTHSTQAPHNDDTEQTTSELDPLLVDNSTPHTLHTQSTHSPHFLNEKPIGNAGSLDAKEIRNKNIYNNNIIIEKDSENKKRNKKKLKDLSFNSFNSSSNNIIEKEKETVVGDPAVGEVAIGKKEVLGLIGEFCDTMGYPFNKDTIGKNYKVAKELLQTYTKEDIIKSVRKGIEMYKDKGESTPAIYIPTLASVQKMIHVWLTEVKKEEEKKKNNDW